MEKELRVKLPVELIEKIDEECRRLSHLRSEGDTVVVVTRKDFIRELVEAYFKESREEKQRKTLAEAKTVTLKDAEEAVLISKASCVMCKRELQPGWRVYRVKNWGILCIHCARAVKLDAGLLRLEKERWKLKRLISQLRQEYNELMERVHELEWVKNAPQFMAQLEDVARRLRQVLTYDDVFKLDSGTLRDLIDAIEELNDRLRVLDQLIEKYSKKQLREVETIAV